MTVLRMTATDSNSWQTSGPESFAQWYATVPEVNQAYLLELYLAPQTGGTFAFASAAFFPLDDAGFGQAGQGLMELHDDGVNNFNLLSTVQLPDDAYNAANGETYPALKSTERNRFIRFLMKTLRKKALQAR